MASLLRNYWQELLREGERMNKTVRRLIAMAVLGFCVKGTLGKEPVKKIKLNKGIAACQNDIQRFCKDIKPGEGRIGRCLYENLEQLSKSCKAYASHGGKGHELESLSELDKLLK